ncbi:phosphoribosylglycinamide formyltransferase [Geofilum rubicundum JCM 15548]|uniref:phosphoribosylglycinamide formyltransferase 1 n=2 Tax=Geofilum TaxID=1236988 RepID=A0A0E9LSC2_9BACT|nr:phosphoribosylglycinamide formyltransferase [Geofilum rubicundum JCM 15548]
MVFSRESFYNNGEVLKFLLGSQPDLIVLAGFLWLVPQDIVKAFPDRIVNIHPALLPKYGGKGMYGDKVHNAVLQNGERESGITIHFVNEHFDEGNTLFQATCSVEPGEDRASLVQKIHALEHTYFPKVIEQLLA